MLVSFKQNGQTIWREMSETVSDANGREYYTIYGAAKELKRSTRMVKNYIQRGKILAYDLFIEGYRAIDMQSVHDLKQRPCKAYLKAQRELSMQQAKEKRYVY